MIGFFALGPTEPCGNQNKSEQFHSVGAGMALKCKINLGVVSCSTNHSAWKHGDITREEKEHKPHLVNANQWQLIKRGNGVNNIAAHRAFAINADSCK